VAWKDYTDISGSGTDLDIFYKYKLSGGSWSTSEVVSTESTATSSKPKIAVDSEDKLHLIWADSSDISGAGTDNDIFYKSKPSGGSWSSLEIVSSESTGMSELPDIFIDISDNVHLVWRDFTDYLGSGSDDDVFYKRKLAQSGLWSVTEVVSDVSEHNLYSPTLVVDSDG
ncbi:MAG: hypothetical protein ACTSQ2_09380, partial [Candidatus Heimdallarchaeaceae archaeon]